MVNRVFSCPGASCVVVVNPMKKSDEKAPTQAAESVTVPPIIEPDLTAGEQPAEITDKGEVIATVTAPPIEEPTPTAKPVENTAPAETITAPPIGEGKATIPPPGKGSRTLSDYLNLDWTKTNADLARETNVTRQAIAQMRKKVETAKAAGAVPTFADVTAPAALPLAAVVDYKALSYAVFDMSTGILTSTLGPEWQPREPNEREAVCIPLSVYFQSKQMQDLPPGLMLTAVVIAYAAPRLRAPSTSSKLQMGWTWLKLKLAKFKKVKKP